MRLKAEQMDKDKNSSVAVEERKQTTPNKVIDNRSPKSDAGKSLTKFDPLQRYLSEISRYRLLTRDEEVELGRRVQE